MRVLVVLACIVFIAAAIAYAESTPEQDRPQPFGTCAPSGQGC